MPPKAAATTIAGIAAAIVALLLLLAGTIAGPIVPRTPEASAIHGSLEKPGDVSHRAFEDLQADAQHFADELGHFKELNRVVSPAELAKQATAENTYRVPTQADSGKRLDAETIYARSKPGVIVLGGIFKCAKCNHWHVQCASGFVVGPDGLIVTSLHTIEAFAKLEALGAMTSDGRVFPVQAVLASSRLNDLALLKADAANLAPLPVSDEVSVGATVYCLSHPALSNGKTNGFYTFSQGLVCGKFRLGDKQEPLNVLAVTADYGPGSSGGPLLNEHGAVVAVACQAIPLLQREKEKNVQMVWKFARPSCSILALLQKTTRRGPSGSEKNPASESAAEAPSGQVIGKQPAASGTVSFELRPCDRPPVTYHRPVAVELTTEPGKQLKTEPVFRSKKPLYGILRLGDREDNRILVALDEPEGEQPKIYVDCHGDGDLAHGTPGNWDRCTGNSLFAGNVMIDVPYRTGKIPYRFAFYRMPSRMPDRLFYYRNAGREGEVILDGNRYRVLVLDDNADGRFDDLQHGNLFIDLNQDGKLEGEFDSAECFPLGTPFNVHGKVWEVASLSPDGLHLTLQRSLADVPIKPYLNAGYPAPEFVGRGLDGQTIDLRAEASKAKYVLLDFWASWCGPCRGEFPTLRRAYARYKDHGLTVIGINLDSDEAAAVNAANRAALNYPHVFDGQGWSNAVALSYRVHGIPQVYLLDSELKIVAKNLRGPALEQRLRELLGPGDEDAVQRATPEAREPAR
jgi:S1-C subfamily serine protease/thiol-disulfide isomerase/thioredoxin